MTSLRVRVQTDVRGPWIERPFRPDAGGSPPPRLSLGSFDRPTPVSYRLDATLADGQTAELWGYFQTRTSPSAPVIPDGPLAELQPATPDAAVDPLPDPEVVTDLLPLIDPQRDAVSGQWQRVDGRIESPRSYGARLEIPFTPPAAYELTAIIEPLDAPNALNLGQVMGDRRFLVLLNYTPDDEALHALENVDGRNVGGNATARRGPLFAIGRLSHVQVRVELARVRVVVDGTRVIDWTGDPARLSLGEYWSTPHADRLFLGAYDCRYRFHRLTLRPLDVPAAQANTPDGDVRGAN